jgi:tRNA modification GTPase
VPRAEAIGALIAAREPGAALRCADNLAGAISSTPDPGGSASTASASRPDPTAGLAARAGAWRDRLAAMIARCELALDFSDDEDLTYVADPPRLAREVAGLRDETGAVATRVGTNSAAADLADVVLAGPANAGKSSLFNALVGDRRAIVTRLPGTTRDSLAVELADPAIRLWDTAGLREPDANANDIDRWAEEAARNLSGCCDLLIWCWPADAGPLALPDGSGAGMDVPDCVIAETKADLATPGSSTPDGAVRISVHSGTGVEQLRSAIRDRLMNRSPDDAGGSCTLTNARQAAHLRAATEALARAVPLAANACTLELASLEMGEADRELAGLLGLDARTGVVSDAILHRIFGAFCVGK